MKYSARFTVKWHDTDANRQIRPSQLLMYMQETANLHLRDYGMELDELRDRRGLAFLLSRISIEVLEPLRANDEIEVQTWITESRGLAFNRCFRILRGTTVASEAYSVWALMDLNGKKLVRSTEFAYPFEGEAALSPNVPMRLHVPAVAEMDYAGERKIVYSDIDYNGHMNNTRYPDMLCDFTPGINRLSVTGITLSYLREAAFGQTVRIYRRACENGFLFRTLGEDDQVCLEALLMTKDIGSVTGLH